ncbi:MAG TPA: hypothetical protein VJK07_03805 [Candidatus Nanoarchaeia archaeon]|nr:hypothetical protein [Candidatus Nanoarchaeia archaeon]
MVNVDWLLHPGSDNINWVIAPKHHRPPSHFVALISAPSDAHPTEMGRIERLALGTREHKTDRVQEPCLLMYLIVSSGDHGWWQVPLVGTSYRYGFHPVPEIFHRLPSPYDYVSETLARQNMGLDSFWKRAVALRMNGTTGEEALSKAEQSVRKDYRALFGEPFPLQT